MQVTKHFIRYYYFCVNPTDDHVDKWHFFNNGSGMLAGAMVRSFDVDTQTEGCVADHELRDFYIGKRELEFGNTALSPVVLVHEVKFILPHQRGHLTTDAEALTIYGTRVAKCGGQLNPETVFFAKYRLAFFSISFESADYKPLSVTASVPQAHPHSGAHPSFFLNIPGQRRSRFSPRPGLRVASEPL